MQRCVAACGKLVSGLVLLPLLPLPRGAAHIACALLPPPLLLLPLPLHRWCIAHSRASTRACAAAAPAPCPRLLPRSQSAASAADCALDHGWGRGRPNGAALPRETHLRIHPPTARGVSPINHARLSPSRSAAVLRRTCGVGRKGRTEQLRVRRGAERMRRGRGICASHGAGPCSAGDRGTTLSSATLLLLLRRRVLSRRTHCTPGILSMCSCDPHRPSCAQITSISNQPLALEKLLSHSSRRLLPGQKCRAPPAGRGPGNERPARTAKTGGKPAPPSIEPRQTSLCLDMFRARWHHCCLCFCRQRVPK